ncbi:MAG: hypothetical protein NTY19_47225 [Planctomycetota bacterium]|nr:hypothetical protein [Planctomycetota bacterium]
MTGEKASHDLNHRMHRSRGSVVWNGSVIARGQVMRVGLHCNRRIVCRSCFAPAKIGRVACLTPNKEEDDPMTRQSAPTTQATDPIPPKPLLEVLPQWIVAATAVIYATGFLVVLAFLDRFGIREAGTDFWKARYIHIGILCLAFPLILNGTILSLVHLVFHGKFNRSTMWQRLLPIGLLVINLELVCFILIMVTNRVPGGTSIAGLTPLQWILAATLLGVPCLLLIERIIEKVLGRIPKDDSELSPVTQSLAVNGRWVLTLVVACLDVWYFVDFKNTVSGVQPALALTYVGLCILLGVMISTVTIYERRQPDESRRKAITILAAGIIGPFLYLVVLAFSYGVFQNIPATRGGGDYTMSPKVVLTLRSVPTMSVIDARYFDKASPTVTIPLILIEETAWALYLADPQDAGGPSEWKGIGGAKPEILVVNKAEVARFHSESRNTPQKTP